MYEIELKTGMVFSSRKAPKVFNEITGLYTANGKKMVSVSQFSAEDEDVTVSFYENELRSALRSGLIYLVNNWASRN